MTAPVSQVLSEAADKRSSISPEAKLESLWVIAIFATGFSTAGISLFAGVLTGLVMTAVCMTYAVVLWRRGV